MPRPGDRVVLRYRLPPGSSHPMTDVLGILEERDPVTVRRGDGAVVRVAASEVVALRAVPPAPVSIREIRAVEHAAALAWPGVEHEWLDGWLLRAGLGFTARANSGLPLGPPPDDAVARVRAWYAARDLPARITLPDRLGPVLPAWDRGGRVLVMTASCAGLAGAEVDVRDELDGEWLGAYRHPADPSPSVAAAVLRSVVDGALGFARITDDGAVLAIARGAVTPTPDGRRWLGISAVEVVARARRQGLARRLVAGLATWGREQGAEPVYLQVSADNDAALPLYAGLGFTEHHGYVHAREPTRA